VNSADVVTITTSIGNLVASIQQNEIFREQNRIIAGTKMPEALSKSALRVYWPTIASVVISGFVLLVMNRSEMSWKLATICGLGVLLAFVFVYLKNASARKSLLETNSPPIHPVPLLNSADKPQHNVQCTGFKVFMDDNFITATLSFRNVPNGKLLGKFQMPYLRVIYYDLSTGEEVADMCRTEWWNEEGNPPAEIGSQEQYAVVASCFKGDKIWDALELVEDEAVGMKLHSVKLPVHELHIVASLSAYPLRIPPVEGILTLGEDGSASFKPTKGFIRAI
jgi:hypothetical protein